jgi:hypothetical protein
MLQVGLDGSDDHPCLEGDEFYSNEGDANPGINHDTFVEDAIQDLDNAAIRTESLDGHAAPPSDDPSGARRMPRTGA